MNETVLTFEDAARCLPDLVERVEARGEAALLVTSGRAVARIVPVPKVNDNEDLIAFLGRWSIEHPNPDDQLADAIEESRAMLRTHGSDGSETRNGKSC